MSLIAHVKLLHIVTNSMVLH